LLYHNSIRKYTLALLSTFNNLKVEHTLSDASVQTKNIPITFANKEKSDIFSKRDTEQLLNGNNSFLPRASLSISSMIRQEARITNKFVKINTLNGDFSFNAMPYEFAYELEVQCRGMNEASMIVEQIATKFNPTYTLRINEVPNQTTPTTIPVQLLDIDIQASEYEDISMNLVIISVGLSLKGNFYPPITSMEQIENVDMFVNMWHTDDLNEFNRATLYNYNVVNNLTNAGAVHSLVTTDGVFGTIIPTISSIFSETSGGLGIPLTMEVVYTDYDNQQSELIFVWNVTGNATITSGSRIVELTGNSQEVVDVSVLITDIHGNSSGTFIKQITIV
jgi:hypothetical protein